MTNRGLEKFLNENDINLKRTQVGDRNIIMEMQRKNIVITGGAGFIGSECVRKFLENKNYNIYNIDSLTYAGNLSSLKTIEKYSNYFFLKEDIRDEKKRQLKNLEGFVQCKGGYLIIESDDLTQFSARFFNLHSYDYGLFYGDIMRDSLTRVRSFFNQTKK